MSQIRDKGIIFDLDGTLLDTLTCLAIAFNRALIEMKCPGHEVAAYKYFIGDGAEVAARRSLPSARLDEGSVAECVERFQNNYRTTWHENTAPYPGILDLLAQLQGVAPLAVLSNKDEEFTQRCVGHFFPSNTFEIAVGHSSSVKHKPDPSGVKIIASLFNITSEDLFMVGDTATDMLTAKACRMTGVGVLWGFRDGQELLENGARHLIATPKDLLQLL